MKRCFVVLLVVAITSLPSPFPGGKAGDQAGHSGTAHECILAFGAESVVCVTKKGKKYHKATCRVLKDSETQKLSRTEAEGKGYKPCKICKP